MNLPSVRSFETRLEKAGTPDALRRLAAELDDIRHHQFGQREQALIAKVAEDGLAWADIVPAISAAPFWRTSHQMIEAAAVAGKLASLADVSQAVDLIHPQGEFADQAMSAVRDAAKPFLVVTSETTAEGLEAIVRVMHQILVSPELYEQIVSDVVGRAAAICQTAEMAAAFTCKFGGCKIARNRLLVAMARKLRDAGEFNTTDALTLLGAIAGSPKDGSASALRARRDILGMLAVRDIHPSDEVLLQLAGYVDDFTESGDQDPDKPEDPRLVKETIIDLLAVSQTTARRVLEVALLLNSPSAINSLLAAFAGCNPISEETGILFAFAGIKDTPGYDRLAAAIRHRHKDHAESDFDPMALAEKLKNRRARNRPVAMDVPPEIEALIANLERLL